MKDLKKMGELKLTDEDGDIFEKRFDEKLWANLDKDPDKILIGEYRGQDKTVFQVFRRGRSADDIRQSSLRLLITVKSLQSHCFQPEG